MTSNSEQDKVSRKAVQALERANDRLSDDVLADIHNAREQALNQAQHKPARLRLVQSLLNRWQRMRSEVLVHQFRYAAPVAVAVIVAVLVSYDSDKAIPALPEAFLSDDIPGEELAMLEELEFASWLAEQQQEGHL